MKIKLFVENGFWPLICEYFFSLLLSLKIKGFFIPFSNIIYSARWTKDMAVEKENYNCVTKHSKNWKLNGKPFPKARGRSSHQRCSMRKGVLRNLTEFTGKHFCQRLFFNKVAVHFIKKEPLVQVFSCEFCEISKNTFFTEHLWTTASKET